MKVYVVVTRPWGEEYGYPLAVFSEAKEAEICAARAPRREVVAVPLLKRAPGNQLIPDA